MRNNSIDIIRGALMLYVISIIHGVFWLNLIPRPYSTILLFEMPPIFIISGYAYALFQKSTNFTFHINSYFRLAISRLLRILIPYFAYAMVCAVIVISLGSTDRVATIYAWLNPLTHGRGFSYGMLTWHLWFIEPFLIVTLLLPIVTMSRSFKPSPWLVGGMVCVLIFILDGQDKVITSVFYLFWAWFGYQLANGIKISRRQYLMVIIFGILALLVSKFLFGMTLDMQDNKFPPNVRFFIFSAVWVSFFLLITTYIDPAKFSFLAQSKLFKPFMKTGYSVYLWQGVGYTAAQRLFSENKSIYLIWGISIMITVVLGVIFGPFERIKLRDKKKRKI